MADAGQSMEEWLAEERKRLDTGFTFTPGPTTSHGRPSPLGDITAGLGLGAGVVAGAVASHPNPSTYEGVGAIGVIQTLHSELGDNDTQVGWEKVAGETTWIVTVQKRDTETGRFQPALSVTLAETGDGPTLTVSVSSLRVDVKTDVATEAVRTAVGEGTGIFGRVKDAANAARRGGIAGMAANLLDGATGAASAIAGGIGNIVESVSDSIETWTLPRRIWEIIDRVAGSAEKAYLDEQRKAQEFGWKREAAERAWTHCESCGRAYREDEDDRVDCSSCGAPRGVKPAGM